MSGPPARPVLILASTSPYRRSLLERLGVPFHCVAPRVDEVHYKRLGLPPRNLAEVLAEAKARSVAEACATAGGEPPLVIGCDQVASLGRQILGKPGSTQGAVEQLMALAGKQHELITSVALVRGERLALHTDVALLTMRQLTPQEIARYVEADRPLDCAGSFKIESRGIALFEEIRAADHSAITGLPLMALTTLLREFGLAVL